MLLAIATADANTVDDISLLSFIAKTTGLVGARRARCAVYYIELTIFPASIEFCLNGTPNGTFNKTHRTRRRNRRTSDCFFLYNSPTYLNAPILLLSTRIHLSTQYSSDCRRPYLLLDEAAGTLHYGIGGLNNYAVPRQMPR